MPNYYKFNPFLKPKFLLGVEYEEHSVAEFEGAADFFTYLLIVITTHEI